VVTRTTENEHLLERIEELKAEKNAVILAHNYQRAEVQDVADYTGDSLGLSRQAAAEKADVIVFCGVTFMAETAKVLSPERTVLIPDRNAGCPMADMITDRELAEAKARHPDALVVCYVNSSAAIKAESHICCTSGNAIGVVESIPADRDVLFIPDASLGDYVARRLGRELILWDGYCPTHHRILPEHIAAARAQHPGALVVVHPECRREVVDAADEVASTSGMLRFCRESDAREFIIGTEVGLLHRLGKENPEKRFYPASPFSDCPNMKLTTLEKVVWSLEDMQFVIELPPDIIDRARRPLERMLAIA